MADNGMQRKLRAIFSADVKGYSKLMGEDDEHTINTITAYRRIITELIEAHHGRVVDAPGDNILAEFSGALNAVNSAIAIQEKLALLEDKECHGTQDNPNRKPGTAEFYFRTLTFNQNR